MFTAAALASLAPVGRRAATGAVRQFLQEGPSLGDLGIIPLIVGVAAAGGQMYAADKQAGAMESVGIATAEAQAAAMIAPFRYEFKTQKRLIAAQRFSLAIDAVSGKTVRLTEDKTGMWIAIGLGVAVLAGGFFIMKGV